MYIYIYTYFLFTEICILHTERERVLGTMFHRKTFTTLLSAMLHCHYPQPSSEKGYGLRRSFFDLPETKIGAAMQDRRSFAFPSA